MTRDEIKSLLIDHRCDHPSGELLDRLASAGASVVPKESTATDEVSVTQADRDAAAAYWRACGIGTDETRRHYAIGKGDDSNIVQAFARHRIASEQSRPTLSNKVVDTPLNKTFRAKSTSELKAKIYSAHGWKRKAGESMGERIAALYECSTDFERGDVVAKPRNPIATASEQPRTTQCSGDADRIVDCLCASLRGTDEAADQWTFAGMQDAFFRWPVVERELRRVLSALRTTHSPSEVEVEAFKRVIHDECRNHAEATVVAGSFSQGYATAWEDAARILPDRLSALRTTHSPSEAEVEATAISLATVFVREVRTDLRKGMNRADDSRNMRISILRHTIDRVLAKLDSHLGEMK